MALSSAFLESGVFILEQSRSSFYNGATLTLLFYEAIMWAGIWLVVSRPVRSWGRLKKVRISSAGMRYVVIFVAAALLALLINMALTGAPILSSTVTRFNYWDYAQLRILNIILGDVATPLLVMIGVVYALAKVGRYKIISRVSIILFATFMVYYFMLGQKFSMQILAISLFIPPYLYLKIEHDNSLGLRVRDVLMAAFGLIVLVLFVAWSYLQKNPDFVSAQGGVFKAITYRFLALQGHLWWGGYTEYLQQGAQLERPLEMIWNGMRTMMYAVAPRDLVDTYLAAGVRFTMAYPAIILYSLGAVGAAFFQLVIGVMVGLLVIHCERQLLAGRLFGSIATYAVIGGLVTVLNMGEFSSLASAKVLAPCVAALFLWLISAGVGYRGGLHVKKGGHAAGTQ